MIVVDMETKSHADLKKTGAWSYSEHDTTQIICICWGWGDRPRGSWWPDKAGPRIKNMPAELYEAIYEADEKMEAWNLAFEWSMWENVMVPRYGWPSLTPCRERLRDTMATAAYYAMPQALDKMAHAIGLPGKDKDGQRLISTYSKLYLKKAKPVIPEHDFLRFVDYCDWDVATEQDISDWLGDLPEREVPIFLNEMEIGMRGILLDLESIENALAVTDKRAADLALAFKKLTGLTPTQNVKVLAWLRANGLPELPDCRADTLEELLEDGELGQGLARTAIEIRMAASKASTKKLDAMARQRGHDGYARFQMRYHGAATGRPTGTGFQPLNLNRGFSDYKTSDGKEFPDPETLIRDISYRDPEYLDLVYGDALSAIAKASRHHIIAPPGHRIISGDYSSIEAVGLACLAGEDWKIQAFRSGAKIYELMADMIYDLPPGTVTKATHPEERQDGKTGELAFGYQGALGAWLKFDNSGRHTDQRIIEICRAWRAKHPSIASREVGQGLWASLDAAAIEAVRYPGRETGYRNIGFEVVDEWLTMILPNGKRLWYFDPRLKAVMPKWHEPLMHEECALGTCRCRPRPQVSYMAQKTGRFKRVYSYGGKWAENLTQAACREIMEQAKLRLRRYGYQVVMSVYDEAVAYVPNSWGSIEEFKEIMLDVEPPFDWWPLNAVVEEGQRYKK
jgi:DNA polymerase